MKIAREGHQGLKKTKALIREKILFPVSEKTVNEEISSYLACQAVGTQKAPEPLRKRPIPSGPWKRVLQEPSLTLLHHYGLKAIKK